MSGLTLMELIVSTAVVGIIMMGVVSTDSAIRRQTNTSFQNAQASLNPQGILAHIMNSAFNATGTPADPGIYIGTGGLAANTMCFRTAKAPDNWVCYTNLGTNLYTCTGGAQGDCTAANQDLGALFNTGATGAAWGTANSSLTANFVMDNTVGSQQILFTVSINVPDPSNRVTGMKTATASVSPPTYTF